MVIPRLNFANKDYPKEKKKMGFLKFRFLHKRFCAKLWQRQGNWHDHDL